LLKAAADRSRVCSTKSPGLRFTEAIRMNKAERSISELFDDDSVVDEALAAAARDVLRRHKLLGRPIVGTRDGKIVWIPPEEIRLDDDGEAPPVI
jgi:hypothetical protein